MSANSSIEWTDRTWNPLLGCEKVSAGCDRCYAVTTATIRAGNPHLKVAAAFAGLTARNDDGAIDWTGRINLLPERLAQPLGWRKSSKVFVNSQADLFHKDVPDDFIAQVFAVMAMAPIHTFQLLTKRHARMRSLLCSAAFHRLVATTVPMYGGRDPDAAQDYVTSTWPLPNVWVGVSIEDQHWADIRIPALLDTPAAVRWLSCEPLLGPVKLPLLEEVGECTCSGGGFGYGHEPHCGLEPGPAFGLLHWVVVGGESGSGARPMHPDWARAIRNQCRAAGVPFLFKQWGEYGELPKSPADLGVTVANDGTVYQPGDLSWPDGPRYGEAIRANHNQAHLHQMYRVGKKFAGRELDDRTHDEYPMPALVGA